MRLSFPALLLALLVTVSACNEEPAGTPRHDAPAWSGPGTTDAPPTGRLDRTRAGTLAPAAAFLDPDGTPASLADFRGTPLLINLWATWCAPCVAEMPTLDALAAREEGRLNVLALSQDLNGADKVDAFFARHRFAMLEPYIDPQLAIMAELKVDTLPTTILYDAAGRELWRMTGIADWQSEATARLIAEALEG